MIIFLQLFLFIVLVLFSIYSIGYLFLKLGKQELKDHEEITLSFATGTIIFVLFSVILGLLNLRFLSIFIILTLNIINFWLFKFSFIKPFRIFFRDKILLSLIVTGIIILGLINFPSGLIFDQGMQFWSSQGHDGLWHVSSMEEIKKSFPPKNPGFANEIIYNYHYLVDLLMGDFARIYPFFSTLDLYFRFFPILFSFMIGLSVFSLVARWREKNQDGYWAVFFTYFVGSFGYIVTLIKNGNLSGSETIFWAAQQHTIIGNPPHAISHSLLASFLLTFFLFTKTKKIFYFITSFLIASILAGFKVSGGFVLLAGLGIAAILELIIYRKYHTFLLFVLLGISNFLTFKLVTTKGAESNLMFLPWWFIRTMIVDKLDWLDHELRRQHYLSKGTWNAWLRVIQLETIAFLIFVVGNLGVRLIGILEIIRKVFRKKAFLNIFEVMLLITMLTGLIVPIFFVQRGIIYNNIQFMQYFLFIFGIYGGVTVSSLLKRFKNKAFKFIFSILIIVLSIPTVIGVLLEFYGPGRPPLAIISNSELQALDYLKNNSLESSTIMTKPFNQNLKHKFSSQPLPIYAWYDTSYVSAISARASYLASEHVTLLGYPELKKRQDNKERFFKQNDLSWNANFLIEEDIDFIYLAKNEIETSLDLEKNNLDIFFENDEVLIYKVKPS